MQRTRIKICGLQSPEMALQACDAGADAIGLMFYPPSPRHLDISQAADIRSVLPVFVDAVAVVVNPEEDYLQRIITEVGVSLIQFHGEESNDYCASFGLPFVKVLRVDQNLNLLEFEGRYPDACGILLDTHVKDTYGGSGKTFDWTLAQYGAKKPVILAGGLTAANVTDALDVAKPYAVDVSSGVEIDGKKNSDKIFQFCRNVIDHVAR